MIHCLRPAGLVHLNLRTAYQLHPRLKEQAGLENILDQNYRLFASNISATACNLILTLLDNF